MSDQPSAPNAAERHFADLDGEFAATRRLLERFPAEHADWKPHEKSMPLARLASHIAELPHFAEAMMVAPEFDFTKQTYTPAAARTADALLAVHDRAVASAKAALRALDDASLEDTWTLRGGDTVHLQGRRGTLLRNTLVSHIAHHRGQLTVYYRMLDVPVPGLYGPSADER